MKVVILEPIGASSEKLGKFEKTLNKAGHNLVSYDSRSNDNNEIISRAKDADIIILSNLKFDRQAIGSCKNLKMISVAFTGVDQIDISECKKRNIVVSNAPGYSTYAVSELTIALMISVLRNIVNLDKKVREGKTREGFLGTELKGKTVGIIGTGEIGLRVAKLAKAFGTKVLAYSRTQKNISGIKYVTLDELLKNSDIVSLHIPLTEQTKQIIDSDRIALMKDSSILINTARGGLIDNNALSDALNSQKIAGAGIDVFDYEPPLSMEYKLLHAKNTVLLPHVGFASKEAINVRTDIVFDNVLKFLGNAPKNRVS